MYFIMIQHIGVSLKVIQSNENATKLHTKCLVLYKLYDEFNKYKM